jgi:hypothetical protein
MLPEGGKTAVRSILKPRVELARVIAVLDAMPRRTVRLTNVQESVTGQPVGAADDRELTERLLKAYRLADGESIETGASMWSDFFRDLHGDLHRTFMSGSIADVQAVLRNPGATNLFYGFDSLSRDLLLFAKSARWRRANALAIADSLVRLSEILGARLYPNSEAIANGYGRSETIDATQCLPEIDAALGLRLDVPTPFPDEHGLATDRGVISYRTPQAIYQAMRIRQMTHGLRHPKVLEIGGGLGRTAYYARRLGIMDYSIVDLPITSLAQGSFLGRSLGPDNLALLGEKHQDMRDRVKLVSPTAFMQATDRYDLVVNVDSLTEMSRDVAGGYVDQILGRADAFLSINHEFNPFTVRELLMERRLLQPVTRGIYYMRNGYVEEFVSLREACSMEAVQRDRPDAPASGGR